MSWTREQKIAALLRLPWTIRPDKDVDEGYFIARVAEIPSLIATGATPEELERDFWQSLQASLEVSLDYGDPITPAVSQDAPVGRTAPTDNAPGKDELSARGRVADARGRRNGADWEPDGFVGSCGDRACRAEHHRPTRCPPLLQGSVTPSDTNIVVRSPFGRSGKTSPVGVTRCMPTRSQAAVRPSSDALRRTVRAPCHARAAPASCSNEGATKRCAMEPNVAPSGIAPDGA